MHLSLPLPEPVAALGRLPEYSPVGIVDIGSNSVRLVVYDGARRSPTPLFNEKVLCGLGRGLASTGRMADEAIARALRALTRFRALCEQIGAEATYAFATAAAREAENGSDFISRAEAVLGHSVEVLSGRTEARLAAYGVLSGIPDADGLVGDLGGGSLELVMVRNGRIRKGVTLPLGPLRLIDITNGSTRKARKVIDRTIAESGFFDGLEVERFYAVGGNWRNLARLHMAQNHYPLYVLHHYQIDRRAARAVASLVGGLSPGTLKGIRALNPSRAETLPYAALVLDRLLKKTRAARLVVSAYGAREGMLYDKLSSEARRRDPLLSACWDLARLRARSPEHARELCAWTDQLFGAKPRIPESPAQRRLRHASCMLTDIGWRAHPDYRGEQSMTIVSQGAFVGVDHPGRAFLALTVFHRYEGAWSADVDPRFEELADEEMVARARLVAALQRLAYVLSAAMPGVLPQVRLAPSKKSLTLSLPGPVAALAGERVERRLADLATLTEKKPVLKTG